MSLTTNLSHTPESWHARPREQQWRPHISHDSLPGQHTAVDSTVVLVAHSSVLIAAGLVATLRRFANISVQPWDVSQGPWIAAETGAVDVVFVDSECLRLWHVDLAKAGTGNRRAPKIVWVTNVAEQMSPPQLNHPSISARLPVQCDENELLETMRSLAGKGPSNRVVPRQRVIGGLAPGAMRRVMEHIDAHLSDRIELVDPAGLTGLSDCHFSRAFKQSVGVPPHRYLMSKRISVAAALVARTDLALSDIALEVGFCDQSHFTRLFSKAMGEAPSLYRRRHC